MVATAVGRCTRTSCTVGEREAQAPAFPRGLVFRSASRRFSRTALHCDAVSWAQLIRMRFMPAASIWCTMSASVAASVGMVTAIHAVG
jgi:hypothetical protein